MALPCFGTVTLSNAVIALRASRAGWTASARDAPTFSTPVTPRNYRWPTLNPANAEGDRVVNRVSMIIG
jgi:hypothetical protein